MDINKDKELYVRIKNKLEDKEIELYSNIRILLTREYLESIILLNMQCISSKDLKLFYEGKLSSIGKLSNVIIKSNIVSIAPSNLIMLDEEVEFIRRDFLFEDCFATLLANKDYLHEKINILFSKKEEELYKYIDVYDRLVKSKKVKATILEEEIHFKILLLLIEDKENNNNSKNLDYLMKLYNRSLVNYYSDVNNKVDFLYMLMAPYGEKTRKDVLEHMLIAMYLQLKGFYKISYGEVGIIYAMILNRNLDIYIHNNDILKNFFSKKSGNFIELISENVSSNDLIEMVSKAFNINNDLKFKVSGVNKAHSLLINITKEDYDLLNYLINVFLEDKKNVSSDIVLFVLSLLLFRIQDEKEYVRLGKSFIQRDRTRINDNLRLKELENSNNTLIQEIKYIKYNNKVLVSEKDKSINELELEINRLKKQNKELLDINNKKDLEINSLREQLNQKEIAITNTPDNDKEEIEYKELIKSLRIGVLGGSEVWCTKVRNTFSNFLIYSLEDINKDIAAIKQCDYIFVNSNNSHSFFFKIKSYLEKNNLEYKIIDANTNIDIFSNQIYTEIKHNLINNLKEDIK